MKTVIPTETKKMRKCDGVKEQKRKSDRKTISAGRENGGTSITDEKRKM